MSANDGSAASKPLVCMGEALVDLICPDPVVDSAQADRFEVHFGGALSNVAVAAARAGAPVALASGCGNDRWGRFIRDRLRAEGVDLSFYRVIDGAPTAFAFAFLDSAHEPTFEIHGEGIDAAIAALAGREAEIVDAAGAVILGSNTLVASRSREITARFRERASQHGVPILFDPNLRPGRWQDLDEARDHCLPFVAAASVLKCNLKESRWLLSDPDVGPAAAAEALVELGPELVIVTAGRSPALARGAYSAEVQPPVVDLVSPLGAGDAFMGTLAAGLHAVDFDLSLAEGPVQRAVEIGARTCTHLGAFDQPGAAPIGAAG